MIKLRYNKLNIQKHSNTAETTNYKIKYQKILTERKKKHEIQLKKIVWKKNQKTLKKTVKDFEDTIKDSAIQIRRIRK